MATVFGKKEKREIKKAIQDPLLMVGKQRERKTSSEEEEDEEKLQLKWLYNLLIIDLSNI